MVPLDTAPIRNMCYSIRRYPPFVKGIGEKTQCGQHILKIPEKFAKNLTLPPVTYAGCTFKGSYAQIDEVVAAVSAWIAENGYEPDGSMFDIYHVSPHETDNPDEFVTEVCFPVKRK